MNNSLSHNNIKIDGTFEEWVKSIAKEVERSLAVKSEESDAEQYEVNCTTKVISCHRYEDGERIDWLTIFVYAKNQIPTDTGWEDQEIGRIGFCKNFFDRDHCPKSLRRMLENAFVDFMWGDIFDKGRKYAILAKKLGLDCSIPHSFS